MGAFLLWLVPDIDGAYHRFPVTLGLVLLATALLLVQVDNTDLFDPRVGFGPGVATAQVTFPLWLAAIFWSLAVELYGPSQGWPVSQRVALCLGGALLPLALQVLPDFAPVLSARWLPFNLWHMVWAAALLALAATAAGFRSDAASARILAAMASVVAALLVPWLLLWLVQFWFGASLPFPQLRPLGQVWTMALSMLLALSWLAAATSEAVPGADRGAQPFTGTVAVLRNLLVPGLVVAYLAMAAIFLRNVLAGTWGSIQGVAMIVPHGTMTLLLITFAFLAVYPLRDRAGELAGVLLRAWPILAALAAAAIVYGLAVEIPAVRRGVPTVPRANWQMLGGAHIESTLGNWLFGIFAIVVAALAFWWTEGRDLRLLAVAGAVALLVTGFGPWSLRGIAIAKQATWLEGFLVEREFKVRDGLREAAAASWRPADAADIRSVVSDLAGLQAIGALAPIFRGSTDNPFETWSRDSQFLATAISRRLGAQELAPPTPPTPPSGWPQTPTPPAVPPHSQPVPPVSAPPITVLIHNSRAVALGLEGADTLHVPITFNFNPSQTAAPWQPVNIHVVLGAGGATRIEPNTIEVQTLMTPEPQIKVRLWTSRREAVFDLRPVIAVLRERAEQRRRPGGPQPPPSLRPEPPLIVAATGDGLAASLVLLTLSVHGADGRLHNVSGSGWLLLRRADLTAPPQ
jgi:hypothetical protein